ncbi:choloylglycine hydrolase [Pedobacter sp.]|uniref:choloylglycine hydrolase n=1 Tax=Pedobacter sp. TaxID=1411316 RepID=UPI003D7FC6D1
MCTATTYKGKDHYFGRNLDLEYSYNQTVAITPRNYPFRYRSLPESASHFAMIGMAVIDGGYPLYFDATNEKELSMAGLNFPDNADYKPEASDKTNVASFEFIPYILGQFETIVQVRECLKSLNVTNIKFSEDFPPSPLHWIIADKNESITVESVKEGLKVYDNPVGVLTNNPTFDIQLFSLNDYMSLSRDAPTNNFSPDLKLDTYSRGMGAIGLPGDLSSKSRFAKVVFTKMNSVAGDSESESLSQFFHILGSVDQQRGCVRLGDKYEITIYSSCCNTTNGIYYYKTYENSQITGVDMHSIDLDGSEVSAYPLVMGQQINMQAARA